MEEISLVGCREVAEGSQVLMLEGSHIFFGESGTFAFGPEIYLLLGSEGSEKLGALRSCDHSYQQLLLKRILMFQSSNWTSRSFYLEVRKVLETSSVEESGWRPGRVGCGGQEFQEQM